jgi:WD40 repeat protein
MVAQANRIRDQDPRGALQLGVAAGQFDDNPQTQMSLQQTLDSTSSLRTLRSHTGPVFAVAFAPGGATLATASVDRTARLWDVSDRDRPRQLSQPLTGHTDHVDWVAFAPDGRTLATASADHTVTLWDLPRLAGRSGGEVHEACLRAGGPLDKATWDQYAPGARYQDTCAGR